MHGQGGVHGQGDMHGWGGMCGQGGDAWGACMAGGVRGWGACMARGVCMAGRGHAWPGGVHDLHAPPGQILRLRLERAVHILLECILVIKSVFIE